MTLETLEQLSDDQLRDVSARALDIIKTRDKVRDEEAIAQAKAALTARGIPYSALLGRSPSRGKVTYKAGSPYRHPSKPELTWNGKGQKPNWLRDLEKSGGKAVETDAKPEGTKKKDLVEA